MNEQTPVHCISDALLPLCAQKNVVYIPQVRLDAYEEYELWASYVVDPTASSSLGLHDYIPNPANTRFVLYVYQY